MSTNYKLAYFKGFDKERDLTKTVNYLKAGDFKSAQTKKLTNSDYFRAKINYGDRVLFTFLRYQNETYIVLLEYIFNHEYEKSRFLRGISFEEEDIDFGSLEIADSIYINEKREFSYIEKFISFSSEQEEILKVQPPILLIGSAGSGKTSVTIEKLRELQGRVLYISLSSYLVNYSKKISGVGDRVDFLTFDDFLNRVNPQNGKEVTFESFRVWAKRHKIKEIEQYFEEFRGVITGNYKKIYLSKDEYLNLGIKQSLFAIEQRENIYLIFQKYLKWLEQESLYDNNIVASQLMDSVELSYDYIVIDEIQDFTNVQIYLILKSLKKSKNFIFSGDSNQIIYSNFFSWSNLKTMLFNETRDAKVKILSKNYRSSKAITHISNRVLKLKQLRFGSIDKESNYLIDFISPIEGSVSYMKSTPKLYHKLNQTIQNSIEFAVIVFDEKSKNRVKKRLKTPLIFTISQAKGLEYKNVILFDFISDNSRKFYEITTDISKESLDIKSLKFARAKDKSNHELDKYKIYINALYVAFTRAIENLYIVENSTHEILNILDIIESKKEHIEAKISSTEEWLAEAKRLEKMGRKEQAEAIFNRVKKSKPKNINNKKLKEEVLEGEENNRDIEVFFKTKRDYDFEKFGFFYEDGEIIKLEEFVKRGISVKSINVNLIISIFFANFEKDILSGSNNNYEKLLSDYLKRNKETVLDIELLVEYGAKLKTKCFFSKVLKQNRKIIFDNIPTLFDSCRHGLYRLTKLIIARGVDIDETESHGATPLLGAVDSRYNGKRGFPNIVKLLLENGANPNIAGYKERDTPLIVASRIGHLEVVKLLLEYGADIYMRDKNGLNAYTVAKLYRQKKVVKTLKNYMKRNHKTYDEFKEELVYMDKKVQSEEILFPKLISFLAIPLATFFFFKREKKIFGLILLLSSIVLLLKLLFT
jgi:hypothetical protein